MYSTKTRGLFAAEIESIKEKGLYKEKRFICSPQDAEIEVEYPEGADHAKVLNFCANNYLGLSSHPDVVQAVFREETLQYQSLLVEADAQARELVGNLQGRERLERALAETEKRGLVSRLQEEEFVAGVLNTDVEQNGGSGVGNLGAVSAAATPRHGQPCSAALTLPPLATVWFRAPEDA